MLPIVLFQKTEMLRQCRFFVVFDPPPTLWKFQFGFSLSFKPFLPQTPPSSEFSVMVCMDIFWNKTVNIGDVSKLWMW